MIANVKCGEVLSKVGNRILEQVEKLSLFDLILIDEFRENAEGLASQQLLDLINDFLKGEHDEVEAYIFLKLLAYYPKSMTSYQLTPLMQKLIATAYHIGQSDFYTAKLSMDDLAKIFHRSKKTIHDCVQKHQQSIDEILKPMLEEEKLRKEAREIALRELVEEEKEKLKQRKEETGK
ncbi:MAG: hypothetical protein ACPLOC_08820 [Candidatus Bathyarchaeales archaeon]